MNWFVGITSFLTLLVVWGIKLDNTGPLPTRSERSPRTRDWR